MIFNDIKNITRILIVVNYIRKNGAVRYKNMDVQKKSIQVFNVPFLHKTVTIFKNILMETSICRN